MSGILPIYNWRTPVSDIPQQSVGRFHVKRRIVKTGTILDMNILGYDCCLFCEDTPMVILREGVLEDNDTESVWMSDSPMEYYMAWELVGRTKGPNVLVGGLGLGLLTHLLLLRRDITTITVVEKQSEIIRMVKPYLHPDVEVLCGDFLYEVQRLPNIGREYNTVIADLWKNTDDISREVFEDCQLMMQDYYSEAVHLYWAFQYEVDTKQAEAQLFIDRQRKKED